MGRGGDCRAVRAAWCASLLTLALVARAKGEVATYSGTSDVIPEPPRLIPRIWRATTDRHPVASSHRRRKPVAFLLSRVHVRSP